MHMFDQGYLHPCLQAPIANELHEVMELGVWLLARSSSSFTQAVLTAAAAIARAVTRLYLSVMCLSACTAVRALTI